MMMIQDALTKMIQQEDLTFEESYAVLTEIMTGQVPESQIASLLTGLAIKQPTPDEIAGAAAAMREQALAFPHMDNLLEIVGTGGDHSNSFNISSTAAIVISAAGTPVAKHGNRSASSKSGAADVLEALGINISTRARKPAIRVCRTPILPFYSPSNTTSPCGLWHQ